MQSMKDAGLSCGVRRETQRGGHGPRQQRGVVVSGLRERKSLEQPGEVAVRVDAVGLAGFDERV